MSRPKKQEVDYFPHYCTHGKILFILEARFKNDGYAVFYKLMEVLGKTEGHCYNAGLPDNWEYLITRMNVTEEMLTEILNKLSFMAVIDPGLWKEKKIWMQSFVDSISDVYVRRKTNLPTRPGFMTSETQLSKVTNNKNPQSIVKDSKVKKKFLSDSIEIRLSKLLLSKILNRRKSFKKPNLQNWAQNIDFMLRVDKRSPKEIKEVIEWCQTDGFWQNNILSTATLKKQFDQLALKMGQKKISRDDEPPYWSN